MKKAFNILLWVLGLFLIPLSIAGMSNGDVGAGIFILLLALFALPPVHNFILQRKKEDPAPPVVKEKKVKEKRVAKASKKDKGQSLGIFSFFSTLWAKYILRSSTKDFPHLSKGKLRILAKAKHSWSIGYKEKLHRLLLSDFEKKINLENLSTIGPAYLDFHRFLLSDFGREEMEALYNTSRVVSFIVESAKKEDGGLSPEQLKEIIAYSQSLDCPDFDSVSKIQEAFGAYITKWEIENNTFVSLDSDFILGKEEHCIFKIASCQMIETKEVMRQVNYAGAGLDIPVSKHIGIKGGTYGISTEREDRDFSKGFGVLNVTSKRLLFKAEGRITTIKAGSIVDIEAYDNALVVLKSSGNPLTIRTKEALKLYQYLKTMIKLAA